MTERIRDTTETHEGAATGRDIDAKYAEIVGESGVRAKGKEEGILAEETLPAHHHKKGILGSSETTVREGDLGTTTTTKPAHKEGIMDKIANVFTGKSSSTTGTTLTEDELRHRGTLTEEERVLREKEVITAGETKARVIDERDVETHRTREKVIEEKDIVAPVEHRRVVEQRHPREHIRVIEEVTKLKVATLAASDRRKILDTREDRRPIQRRVIREDTIRAPVEKRKVIEEVWASESVTVYEEKAPIHGGTIGTAVKEEIKSEVKGSAMAHGKFTYKGTPSRTKILDEYTVEGAIETRRQIEEIEVIEIHRVIEEREPLAKPLIDEEVIKKHHAKKW